MNIFVDPEQTPVELTEGLKQLAVDYPLAFSAGAPGLKVSFSKNCDGGPGGYEVRAGGGDSVQITYARKVDAFRALGRLLSGPARSFREDCLFDTLGLQLDVSRNGVLLVSAVKTWLRRCALMGINLVLLYMEDVYEVQDEPYFGYLRGRYTFLELKEMDDYADALGIEMAACIQTLGHLGQMLQYPAYSHVRDTREILLVDEEQTYALLDRMVTAASVPFRSNRIHIGMDEAHGLGSGEHVRRHGYSRPYDIFSRHLERVVQICRSHGLQPMIWSDMFFRLGSKSDDYYDLDAVIPREVIASIPEGVDLVYWDYYHKDQSFYEGWIARHRAMGVEPWVQPGVATWNRFSAQYPYTVQNLDPCMKASKRQGVRRMILSTWGDDGMECDLFSALPGVQFYAEHGYSEEVDLQQCKAQFRGICGDDFDAWTKAGSLDALPFPATGGGNASKWLLWDDPLIALSRPLLGDRDVTADYAALAQDLMRAAAGPGLMTGRLRFPAKVAQAISLKAELFPDIRRAVLSGDVAEIRGIIDDRLPALWRAVRELWQAHRALWLETYKPYGLEVIEGRYGTLLLRLESTAQRLQDLLEGRIDGIPELMDARLGIDPEAVSHEGRTFRQAYTPTIGY